MLKCLFRPRLYQFKSKKTFYGDVFNGSDCFYISRLFGKILLINYLIIYSADQPTSTIEMLNPESKPEGRGSSSTSVWEASVGRGSPKVSGKMLSTYAVFD